MKWISNCHPQYGDTFDDGTVMVKSSENEPLRVHYTEVEYNQKWWSPAAEKRIMKDYNQKYVGIEKPTSMPIQAGRLSNLTTIEIFSRLTDFQSKVLNVLETNGEWMTARTIGTADGSDYNPKSAKAASLRKVLTRLETLGLIQTKWGKNEKIYRAKKISTPNFLGNAESKRQGWKAATFYLNPETLARLRQVAMERKLLGETGDPSDAVEEALQAWL